MRLAVGFALAAGAFFAAGFLAVVALPLEALVDGFFCSGASSADCSGSVTFGDTKTCTITNDDQAGTLIVKKLVINDNGGSKISSDFSFKVNNGTATAIA